MKILFLTTHNLATNPRIVKEIELALSKGHKVELICFEFDNWSSRLNEQLKTRFSNVKTHTINAGRNPLLPWFINVLAEKSNRFFGKIFSLRLAALSQAVSRRSNMLITKIENVDSADFVIGHNPGALFPAYFAAKKFDCPMGFDVEDYHAGEGDNKFLQNLTRQLMLKLLPQMNYVSFASLNIMQHVKQDSNIVTGNWFPVLNYFPAEEFSEPNSPNDGPVKMVWFSQNINAGRGLEFILPAVKRLKNEMELHLIGNLNSDFYEKYLKNISNIIIHPPMKQRDLHLGLEKFDIGLALEPAKDKNNELALSNKILACLQAGLYIVATNTAAQKSFLNELPGHGVCFDIKADNADAIFEKITGEINTIRNKKSMRYKNFETKNWETASIDLLKAWNKQA
ncbi:MAG TPA: hypothetical protein VGP55_04305 [Chitinophagaceae bacterium]|nr:hypothetical protein [Chitinophagaceae bacterium]